jgi:hypothetical protein
VTDALAAIRSSLTEIAQALEARMQARPRGRVSRRTSARWVELATRAADEAMLPGDPEFHSALTSYLDGSSRVAAARSAEDTATHDTAVSRWDRGPAGPPAETPAQASTADDQPADTLPGPGDTVRFGGQIKPLFRDRDRKSMSFALDLWSRADLQAHAAAILERLRNGTMPCDGAWPADKVELFQRWTESGFQP